MSRRDRREQRQRDRHQQRVEKHADKEERKRREAPQRIRSTATGCFAFGVLAILGGIFSAVGTPTFGGEAYTEIVQRLATLSGAGRLARSRGALRGGGFAESAGRHS